MKKTIVHILVYTIALSAFAFGFVAVFPGRDELVYILAGISFWAVYNAASFVISRKNKKG